MISDILSPQICHIWQKIDCIPIVNAVISFEMFLPDGEEFFWGGGGSGGVEFSSVVFDVVHLEGTQLADF